jgi:glycerol-3-phosphate dehydrogenase
LFLSAATARRLVRSLGTEAAAMLGDARTEADLGTQYGAGLTEREVAWYCSQEFATNADDILWRRTRFGLRLDAAEVRRLTAALGDAGCAGTGGSP